MEHLNSRGWNLTDVSRQNIGYDLDCTGPDGDTVHIEVKKVDGKDGRLALTNNEMSVMIAASTRYLLALVIGDGPTAQLALLDPLKDQVPRERVCRRWEWEYTDWSRFADVIGEGPICAPGDGRPGEPCAPLGAPDLPGGLGRGVRSRGTRMGRPGLMARTRCQSRDTVCRHAAECTHHAELWPA